MCHTRAAIPAASKITPTPDTQCMFHMKIGHLLSVLVDIKLSTSSYSHTRRDCVESTELRLSWFARAEAPKLRVHFQLNGSMNRRGWCMCRSEHRKFRTASQPKSAPGFGDLCGCGLRFSTVHLLHKYKCMLAANPSSCSR